MSDIKLNNRMRKKIDFLIRDLNYGGAQRQLVTLVKGLKERNLEVTVLYFYAGGPLEKDLKDSSIPAICLNKQCRWDVFGFFWRIFRELKNIEPDVLHGYLGESNLMTIFLKPFLPSTKIIWGRRESKMAPERFDWLGNLLGKLEVRLSYFTDLIIFNSHAGRKDYLDYGLPENKMMVIPNGIDIKRFQPDPITRTKIRAEWGIPEEKFLIGLVARLDLMKDHPNFLKAAALLCQERQDVHFVCVGAGSESYQQQLHQLALDLNISDKVMWTGERPDMPAVHNALDIACSASAYGEGFSNAIGEAMACGVPCVVTDVGDSAWIVGDTGAVIAPQNSEALKNAIKSLIENIKNKRCDREYIRQRIVTNFSVEQLVLKTEAVLLEQWDISLI
ncbi:group 1 glycosyl transferase [Nostoc carneum NIES-2107]|nr:group 1 glycosyl transferase [Nostoc carneum NIES-2107]